MQVKNIRMHIHITETNGSDDPRDMEVWYTVTFVSPEGTTRQEQCYVEKMRPMDVPAFALSQFCPKLRWPCTITTTNNVKGTVPARVGQHTIVIGK